MGQLNPSWLTSLCPCSVSETVTDLEWSENLLMSKKIWMIKFTAKTFWFEVCLGHLRLLSQNSVNWLAYKHQEFIYHSSGGWKSKVRLSALVRVQCLMGEGNGTPLQYSCLENPMDGGAWWAAVHGVAKSWTWLNNFTFTFQFHALEMEMATHSSVLAGRIPGVAEPGGLPSMELHRVGHDRSDLAAAVSYETLFPSSPMVLSPVLSPDGRGSKVPPDSLKDTNPIYEVIPHGFIELSLPPQNLTS